MPHVKLLFVQMCRNLLKLENLIKYLFGQVAQLKDGLINVVNSTNGNVQRNKKNKNLWT